MRRNTLCIVATLLGVFISGIAQAELRGYDVPKGRHSFVDSLSFRKNGSPSVLDCLIGAADKDTTTNIIPLAGLKAWSVMWSYTDAPGPTTSGTWAVRCTLQVSNDSTNWTAVAPGGDAIWAHTASRDSNIFQVLLSTDFPDSAVGTANDSRARRMISTARFGRFILTVANSADDTVYLRAFQSRLYSTD